MTEERSHMVFFLVWFVLFVWIRIYPIKTTAYTHGKQDQPQDSFCLVWSRLEFMGVQAPNFC